MASANVHRSLIPQQRKLEKEESEIDFEIWRESMIFHISLDGKCARFTSSGDLKTWNNTANRGFTDDGTDYVGDTKMTAAAKASALNIILKSVAYNAPVVSWNFVTQQATSLDEIWNRLRQRFGIKKSGARITELVDIQMEPGESREALWERIYSFVEDTFLVTGGAVKHEEVVTTVNETFTPALLNMMVVIWLHKIHRELPAAVRHEFATNLRTSTIYTYRVEISDAVPVLLTAITEKEANISRAGGYGGRFNSRPNRYSNQSSSRFNNQPYNSSQIPRRFNNQPNNYSNQGSRKRCCLCKEAGRSPEGHYLSTCPFLPTDDKRFFAKTRESTTHDDDEQLCEEFEDLGFQSGVRRSGVEVRRVDIVPSPVLTGIINSHTAEFTLDCGAESNMIEEEECEKADVEIIPTNQTATMADGRSSLEVVGETHFYATHGHHTFEFSALVVKKLDTPILAGMPFLKMNDVYVRPKSNTIYLGDCCTVNYPHSKPSGSNRRCTASILNVPKRTCILPGETIQLPLPEELQSVDSVALEPRYISSNKIPTDWLNCDILSPENGKVRIRNSSSEPVLLEKHDQFCQVRPAVEVHPSTNTGYKPVAAGKKSDSSNELYSSTIQLDPSSKLSPEVRNKFLMINRAYDSTFSPSIGCYNGKSGRFSHVINMAQSLPPPRKGRVPLYKRTDLETLQLKFDELLSEGVFARPEDVQVPVEYVHPSFLVKKKSGDYRLVTSFGQVGEYAKPQPTLMSNVEDALRQIGQWKHIIKTDLKNAYYQIPLEKDSMRYAGVATPFRGTYVYCRSVMGLPGSESALEEMLSRVLGDLILQRGVVKLADDLYCGSESLEELADIWESMLSKLHKNGLKLSPGKTVICPASTVILGWLWEEGTIRATPHRLNALMECGPPETITAMRSFVGAYNFITRVLPFYADKLDALEKVIAGSKTKTAKIEWTPSLLKAFNDAKDHLKEAKSVTLPRADDQLVIVTDAAVRCAGIGSALYVVRGNRRKLAGYFNAKRHGHQVSWLPCEVEALSIGCSIRHFGPQITQSVHRTKVYTDSKPCVDAYRKLCRGQFSASPRVTTFLSIASRYNVEIAHIPGSQNTLSDFISRHPLECSGCQVCEFVKSTEEAVVREVTVKEILNGEAKVPFTSRASWYQIQQNCPDLVQVHKYLKDGLSPSKKKRNITNVRRYLNTVKLSTVPNDGLLVVLSDEPFKKSRQRIVIPRAIVDGLLTALHIQLKHPTKHQMQKVFSRAFFCLDMDKFINNIVDSCHTCAALKKVPSLFHQQSTSEPPDSIGSLYSTDVLRRYCQCILVLRECISAFTEAVLIPDEKADSLRDGLLCVTSKMRSSMSPPAKVRSDGCTSFQALVNDKILLSHQIHIEIGDVKNANKNPVCEKAIEELHGELVRLQPLGGKVTEATLACAVSNLNSRIRHNNLSAVEMWTQRDMSTGSQLSISDKELIDEKVAERRKSHLASAKYKARGKDTVILPDVKIGDVVFLYSDRSKLKEREKYLVVKIDEDYALVQKFTSQQLRAKRYRVKMSDIITVKSYPTAIPIQNEAQAAEYDEFISIPGTEVPPEVRDESDEGDVFEDSLTEVGVSEEEVDEDSSTEVGVSEDEDKDENFQAEVKEPVQNTAAVHRPRRNDVKLPSRYRQD